MTLIKSYMPVKTILLKLLLLLLLTGTISGKLWAAKETYNARISGTQLQQNALVMVKDNKYDYMLGHATGKSSWDSKFANKNVYNRITLGINPYSSSALPSTFSLTVTLKVEYYTWDYTNHTFVKNTLTPNVSLAIDYSSTGPYKDKSVYQFAGGNRMNVTILSVSGSTSQVPSFVTLDCDLIIERYTILDTETITTFSRVNDLSSQSGEVEVCWNVLPGAESYDFEWTYINDFDPSNGTKTPASGIPFSKYENGFGYNSTRISTPNTSYRIPLLYERGYLLFRVRGIGLSSSTGFTTTAISRWSDEFLNYSTVSDYVSKFYIATGHVKNLNWQGSISFAEEGKNKSSVSYFDGSLRNRQVITKMNTDNNIIVGETVYDWQGRPAVQILPAPVVTPKVEYVPDLNKDNNSKPYSKDNFDVDRPNNQINADPMTVTTGASNYYSPSNPNTAADLHEHYLPDAKGYPFTQTRYTNDNTGRIFSQSGIGTDHKLGSGHETQYIYSTPNQDELDRLFATEVGAEVRYKKNLVIDANGQVSISYLDPQGRVIATALAGGSPDNLDPLATGSLPQRHMDIDLLPGSTSPYEHQQGTDSRIYSRSIPVSTKGVRTFSYSFQSDKFVDVCQDVLGTSQGTGQRCYDCVYTLQISLKDAYGNDYLTKLDGITAGATSVVIGQQILNNMRSNNYSVNCSSPSTNSNSFSSDASWGAIVALPVGSYEITKVVTLNDEAAQYNLQQFLTQTECLLSFDDFYHDKVNNTFLDGCNNTCDKCLQNLGGFTQYDVSVTPGCNPCMSKAQYDQAVQDCNALCDGASDCDNLYQSMLSDVSPFGQYGTVVNETRDANGNSVGPSTYIYDSPEKFPLSIFNMSNALPLKVWYDRSDVKIVPNWKNPYRIDAAGNATKKYYDNTGAESFIQVHPVANGYLPLIDDGVVPTQQVNAAGVTEYYVRPQDLKMVKDFLTYWNEDSWANSLVVYHPEYCYYQFCTKIQSSHDFDFLWNSLDKVATAGNAFHKVSDNSPSPLGYLNPLGNTPADAIDPYFYHDPARPDINPEFDQQEYDAMKNAMKYYSTDEHSNPPTPYNIWQVIYMTWYCPYYNSNVVSSCNQAPLCLNITTIDASTIQFTDDMWKSFQGLYYGLKRKFQEQKATKYAIKNGCYNGCLDVTSFDMHKNNFFETQYKVTKIISTTYLANIHLTPWSILYGQHPYIFGPPSSANPPYTAPLIGSARYYWWWPNYMYKTRTNTITLFQSQFYNPEQPCSKDFFALYLDKNKRYNTNTDGLGDPNLDNSNCYDNSNNGAYSLVNCPQQTDDLFAYAKKKTDFASYEECGQCRNTKLLELFFASIAKNDNRNFLYGLPYRLNCLNPQSSDLQAEGVAEFVPDLETAINFSGPNPGDINWTLLNQTSTDLHAQISKAVAQTCDVYLRKQPSYTFVNPDNNLPSNFTFAWSDIKDICCMQYKTTSYFGLTIPAGSSDKFFSMNGTVMISFDQGATSRAVKIEIEGYTTKVSLVCLPPTFCTSLAIATDIQSMWNTLLYNSAGIVGGGTDENGNSTGDNIPSVTSKFLLSSFEMDNNLLPDQSNIVYTPYEDAITQPLRNVIYPVTGNPLTLADPTTVYNAVQVFWSASIVGNTNNKKVAAILSRVDPVKENTVAQFQFEFDMLDTDPYTFINTTIISFVGINPDDSAPDPSRNFKINALIRDNATGVKKYITMKGFSSIPIGSCSVAVYTPPATANPGGN